jgi:hypothetical protein
MVRPSLASWGFGKGDEQKSERLGMRRRGRGRRQGTTTLVVAGLPVDMMTMGM